MRADLRFPSGHSGRITCSLWSSSLLRATATVTGDAGRLHVLNPVAPQLLHRLTVRAGGRRVVERLPRRSTYDYQLEAFCRAVQRGEPVLTGPADSVATMQVIDAVYAAAAMRPRGS